MAAERAIAASDILHKDRYLNQRRIVLFAVLVSLFIGAFILRLYNLNAAGFVPDREYYSADLARAIFLEHSSSAEDWQRELAGVSQDRLPTLEPPIIEVLAATIYRVFGEARLDAIRILMSVFWLIGGVFLFLTARELMSTEAGIFAVSYFLLVPSGVLTSRSFQPDSAMVMLFLISLFAIVKHNKQGNRYWLLIASTSAALGVLIRPLILFVIVGAFISLALYRDGFPRGLFARNTMLFVSIMMLPSVIYYGYGVIISGDLTWKVTSSFLPELYLTRGYWEGWLNSSIAAVGLAALVPALIGFPLLPDRPRALLVGLVFGYILFCLIFNYHIRFAPYYHLQLVPILAIPLGFVVSLALEKLRAPISDWLLWLAVVGVIFLAFIFSWKTVQNQLGSQRTISPETAQEIGELVNHSGQVVYISRYYGLPLQYLGEISGVYWPRAVSDRDAALNERRSTPRTVEERISALGFYPEYFVITFFDEFNRHHEDLKTYLNANCRILKSTDQYLVFEQCMS